MSQGNSCSTKIALEISVAAVSPVAARSHGSSVARREGVRILGDVAPSQEAFFHSLQLLDMSHRRWSLHNASVALEFGDTHSLAAAAFVTSKPLPGRDLDVAPQ